MNLFVYGSLLMSEVMRRVTGRTFESRAATLRGFVRLSVKNAPYPALLPFPDTATEGRVCLDVDGESVARLDAFEGGLFTREEVTVETDDGGWVEAQTYVVRPESVARLSAEPWDPDEFRERALARYLRGMGASPAEI